MTQPMVSPKPWWPMEVGFFLIPVAAFFLFPLHLPLITEMMILALFAVSLDLVLGYAGIVSLGHAAFFGLGAYAAGILAQQGWGEPLSGLVFAGAVAGVVGLLTGVLVLRGSDLTRLMVTLGIGMMLFEAANKMNWLTGGADGLQGVMVEPLLGAFQFDIFGHTAFWYAYAGLVVLFYVARRLVHSPFGLCLRGIKTNRLRMSALGSRVNLHLLAVYTVGAMMAGIAGGLLAQTTQFVSLDVLSFERSAEVLLVLVLGGPGRLYGGIIGAVAFTVMHEVLSGFTTHYWQFWLGLVLVLLVLFARGGLLGLVDALRKRAARGTASAAAPERAA
ncbi:MAG: branched-chain amino acid ABC transporter permease [Rhodospirillales bacterium]|nr:branched-chain amino acid ABC transporter permease [Rhodospirillales bacterium]